MSRTYRRAGEETMRENPKVAGGSGVVTILFTDLVDSTELLARAGDEEAQRIFRAHHDLAEAAATQDGVLPLRPSQTRTRRSCAGAGAVPETPPGRPSSRRPPAGSSTSWG
ncbi:MAG: hypothetical protein ACRDZ3_10260 [Acidimicrobiia bacterium]